MEAKPSDASEVLDKELNDAIARDADEELGGLSIQNQRLARIQEYEEESVSRPDPFAAVIGMGNAHLQRIYEHLGTASLDELDRGPHTVDEMRELRPEISLLIKLRKSIETDLEFLSPYASQEATAFPRQVTSKKLDTRVATSKRDLLPKRWSSP